MSQPPIRRNLQANDRATTFHQAWAKSPWPRAMMAIMWSNLFSSPGIIGETNRLSGANSFGPVTVGFFMFFSIWHTKFAACERGQQGLDQNQPTNGKRTSMTLIVFRSLGFLNMGVETANIRPKLGVFQKKVHSRMDWIEDQWWGPVGEMKFYWKFMALNWCFMGLTLVEWSSIGALWVDQLELVEVQWHWKSLTTVVFTV